MAKLILLRGNSGSGKTTIAKGLQKILQDNTILISQDIVRREMLFVKKEEKHKVEELVFQLAMYGKKHCKFVIIEGIFYSKWYQHLFRQLVDEFKGNIFAFYFDIPFEETLKRHQMRESVNEFGETQMRQWWHEKDFLEFIPETLLLKEFNEEETIRFIYEKVK